MRRGVGGGGGVGIPPLHIPTLCGPERVLVVSTEPLDDLSCSTTPGPAVGLGVGGCWHPPTAHPDPLWARTCFGRVNRAPG